MVLAWISKAKNKAKGSQPAFCVKFFPPVNNCSLLVLSTQPGLVEVPLDGIKEALTHVT